MVQWLRVCLAMQGTGMGFIPSQGTKIAQASGQLSPWAATEPVHGNRDLTYTCTQSCQTLCETTDCNPPGFLYPWDFPDKNTGVGCHFLLQKLDAAIIYIYINIYIKFTV